ncbi:hypothetical protein DFA_08864 [Cavenderia fasciculata]|uniref:UspA domain-containing protein n=1 Tax=Cavenderia fasciculata TaxID=261658 RepID=F4Q4R7_CACFS|nr:uncharacterized protein DFA_08864 [Cavenderia fasciculata]EGG17863.1 hypothetical protein DFA_08864 [Cavenderia fasciculata]|eukprot:XP_004356347.1 hypothetical protein DFA_08864 [Cavenderia fasciculata]
MKYVVAVDGSDSSFNALEQSLKILKPNRDTIDLVTVIDLETATPEDLVPPELEFINQQRVSQQILDRYSEMCKTKGFTSVKQDILCGDIREEIIKYIEDNGPFEMVIVGSRGLSIVKRIILGSVSEYLVHHAPIPVYVVKHENHLNHATTPSI